MVYFRIYKRISIFYNLPPSRQTWLVRDTLKIPVLSVNLNAGFLHMFGSDSMYTSRFFGCFTIQFTRYEITGSQIIKINSPDVRLFAAMYRREDHARNHQQMIHHTRHRLYRLKTQKTSRVNARVVGFGMGEGVGPPRG